LDDSRVVATAAVVCFFITITIIHHISPSHQSSSVSASHRSTPSSLKIPFRTGLGRSGVCVSEFSNQSFKVGTAATIIQVCLSCCFIITSTTVLNIAAVDISAVIS
jgi:hypothetical protein